ncbi:hypothetical protein, unlikely [Trypanosoma brucei gambiense DAL972]|uniref:Uncharacterized protein n=1 Tax=Trypanosoma brucei gambiense (strain MHOM/CI/86/DAL972) TaxID=679716 RepID=C9ZIX8_TRYB9|nr:hypothetical protein, unlikely [Trypanosoma brucei gambiense DAL972]CBH09345.1 hypothetical protein, unlikely [Trypanosoma brucei gambiense DAL972]|eukprot:XP_011771651.1 hypothetical protein, unlikely [Trypanosoma brucei gambiense DAL972]
MTFEQAFQALGVLDTHRAYSPGLQVASLRGIGLLCAKPTTHLINPRSSSTCVLADSSLFLLHPLGANSVVVQEVRAPLHFFRFTMLFSNESLLAAVHRDATFHFR